MTGAKLSIVDTRCRERSGTSFVVEMQLLHVAGFVKRVVYNACKAYVDQLEAGELYAKLTDVVAISICDFVLWPDAEQEAARAPRIPMLSRWNMTEQASGSSGLLQVQYAFLELAKPPKQRPETAGANLWAWLFVQAPERREIPADLPAGPYREAVELANEATFTLAELDAYRKVMNEIQQAREHGAAQREEGKAEGEFAGIPKGKAAAILAILVARDIRRSSEVRARIEACNDAALLDAWIARAVTASSAEALMSFSPTKQS